jgi:proline iminopeptidase
MPTFSAPDGTRLASRTAGEGDPLIRLPGPMGDAAYLGDLGGLARHRRLVLLDPRHRGVPDAILVVQPGAGHRPWLDDPERFVGLVTAFLGRPAAAFMRESGRAAARRAAAARHPTQAP